MNYEKLSGKRGARRMQRPFGTHFQNPPFDQFDTFSGLNDSRFGHKVILAHRKAARRRLDSGFNRGFDYRGHDFSPAPSTSFHLRPIAT
jgi:hypothetical protein